jgi:hypothetical protein
MIYRNQQLNTNSVIFYRRCLAVINFNCFLVSFGIRIGYNLRRTQHRKEVFNERSIANFTKILWI